MANIPTATPELANDRSAANAIAPAGKVRWGICALLFFATTTNYIDRAVLSVLFPILQKPAAQGGLGWTNNDYGNINTIFSGAYALGLLLAGGYIRKIGIRWGLFWAVVAWTIASRAHGLVSLIDPHSTTSIFGTTVLTTVVAFCVCRIFLGLFEAANFPAAIAATAEWFPKKERALSTGLFNSGANVGAIIAPFVVPQIALKWGWSVAFYITGILAVVWLVLWYLFYQSPEDHKSLTAEERAYIKIRRRRTKGTREKTPPGPSSSSNARPSPSPSLAEFLYHRPHLVVLPLLGPRLPQYPLRRQGHRRRPPPRLHLLHDHLRQRRRWLAFLPP